MRDTRQLLIAIWAVAGVVALVGRGLIALTPIALEPLRAGTLEPWHWVILVGWVVFNAYAEGYRGFHRSFSPRVVRRAFGLGANPSPLRVLLGAPYAMGLFDADRKTLTTSWVLLIGIVLLVIGIRYVPQPWRGIIDAGVVVGLAAGLVSLLVLFVRELRSATPGCAEEKTAA